MSAQPLGALERALADAVADAVAPLVAKIEALTAEVRELRGERGEELLDVSAAAELIGTTPGALRAKIARGTLVPVRRGGSVFLRRQDVVGLPTQTPRGKERK